MLSVTPNICQILAGEVGNSKLYRLTRILFGHSLIILLIDFVASIDNFVEPVNIVELLKISVNENTEEHT